MSDDIAKGLYVKGAEGRIVVHGAAASTESPELLIFFTQYFSTDLISGELRYLRAGSFRSEILGKGYRYYTQIISLWEGDPPPCREFPVGA